MSNPFINDPCSIQMSKFEAMAKEDQARWLERCSEHLTKVPKKDHKITIINDKKS